jgi:hypothetical protein
MADPQTVAVLQWALQELTGAVQLYERAERRTLMAMRAVQDELHRVAPGSVGQQPDTAFLPAGLVAARAEAVAGSAAGSAGAPSAAAGVSAAVLGPAAPAAVSAAVAAPAAAASASGPAAVPAEQQAAAPAAPAVPAAPASAAAAAATVRDDDEEEDEEAGGEQAGLQWWTAVALQASAADSARQERVQKRARWAELSDTSEYNTAEAMVAVEQLLF